MLVLGNTFAEVLLVSFVIGVVLLIIYAVKYYECYGEQKATCRHCHRSVSSKEPWQCWCGVSYPINKDHPTSFFQTGCHECGRTPTTMRCPNCGKGISLHGEPVESNEKWWIKLLRRDYEAPAEPSKLDALREQAKILREQKDVLNATIDITKQEDELDRLNRKRIERNKSIEERAIERLRGCLNEKVAVYMELAKIITEIRTKVPEKKDQDMIIESVEEAAKAILGTEYDMVGE
jgi:hypothetical protein